MKHIVLKNMSRVAKENARLRLLKQQRKNQIKSVIVRIKSVILFVLKQTGSKGHRLLLLFIIMLLVTTMLLSSAAFAGESPNSSSEAAGFTVAVAVAGATTVFTFLLGLRYLIMGDTASGLIKEGKTAGSELISQGTAAGSELISQGKAAGSELMDKGKNDATTILGADSAKDLVDQLVSSVNPLTHIRAQSQTARDKMGLFVKKILKSCHSNDPSPSQWLEGLEGLDSEKVKASHGFQTLLKALDNPEQIDKFFAETSDEEIESMAEFVLISMSRPNSSAGGEMVSVAEPLICLNAWFVVFILALKLAPFYLYFWICIKQRIGNLRLIKSL